MSDAQKPDEIAEQMMANQDEMFDTLEEIKGKEYATYVFDCAAMVATLKALTLQCDAELVEGVAKEHLERIEICVKGYCFLKVFETKKVKYNPKAVVAFRKDVEAAVERMFTVVKSEE